MGTWEFDAPTGVYKNHALSSDIREEAARDFKFMQFLNPEPGFGRNRGETVTITRIKQMQSAGRVAEADDLPTNQPAISTTSITVSEWGSAIPLTSKEELLTHFGPRSKYRRMLQSQMRKTMDEAAATALKSTVVRYDTTNANTGAFSTGGAFSQVSASNLRVAHLRELHDYMRVTLNVEPMRNGMYVLILSTRAARGIKSDPEYKDWFAPTDNSTFRTGRLRDVEGFAIFETNHQEALDDTAGASTVLGEGVAFGRDAAAFAEVLSPELRAEPPRDHGRKMSVAWYGIFDMGLVWTAAADTKAIYIGSQ